MRFAFFSSLPELERVSKVISRVEREIVSNVFSNRIDVRFYRGFLLFVRETICARLETKKSRPSCAWKSIKKVPLECNARSLRPVGHEIARTSYRSCHSVIKETGRIEAITWALPRRHRFLDRTTGIRVYSRTASSGHAAITELRTSRKRPFPPS